MKTILSSRRHQYLVMASIFLITVALIVGIVGCAPSSDEYVLAISSTAGGSVTTPGEGLFTYDEGTVVSLVAEAEEGYSFVNWTGDAGTIADVYADSTNITMNDNYAITANFFQGQLIWDWYDLDAISNNLSASYILMNDLDSTTVGYEELASETANGGKGWQPIGTFSDPFTGVFDGQGYEIRDLFINRPDENAVGLFDSVGEGGVIKNVGVVNAHVIGGQSAAVLVGLNYGDTVSNSYSTGSVTGHDNVGGLVGYNWEGTVSNSYSTGNVTGHDKDVGGLVGWNEGTVSNSYATGSVSGDDMVGGLVGRNYYGTVSNSYSTGSVTGYLIAGGGFVGFNEFGTVTDSFWDTETSGLSDGIGGGPDIGVTGKTTAEMQDIDTFTGATWDIVAVANPSTRNTSYIWNIVDDETYPFLSWES